MYQIKIRQNQTNLNPTLGNPFYITPIDINNQPTLKKTKQREIDKINK